MNGFNKDTSATTNYDSSIIRPLMYNKDVKMRIEPSYNMKLKSIKRGLLTLHTLELMAINIYKYQITKKANELNRQLVAAMCNEITHFQDFQVKLFEYGWRPSRIRWAYWTVGFLFGNFSRVFGVNMILRVGIWVEAKAVQHYAELLETIEWDVDTRRIIEKNQADEYGHINRWRSLLRSNDLR